jgi:hypothetical protein
VPARKTCVILNGIPTCSNDHGSECTQFTKVVSETLHFLGEVFRIEEQGEVTYSPDVSKAKYRFRMELDVKLGCINSRTEYTSSLKQRAPHGEGR